LIRIQEEDFSIDQVVSSLKGKDVGAVVSFLGVVRGDEGVSKLDFEVYEEMAEKKLKDIRREAMEKYQIEDLAIIHRKGTLKVGENIVLVVASAAHRKEAFAACEWSMEQLKKVVPIWKKERKK